MSKPKPITGMPAFFLVWIGQLISILATSMTNFGLTLWAFEKTEKATALALVYVFFITPFLIISPVAGVMVDRYNRKLMMMISDLGAGVATILLLVISIFSELQMWHLYASSVIMGTFNAFQWPAYSAAITLMTPKEQYGRVNGLMSLLGAPQVIAPLIAGAVIGAIGLKGILIFDILTFLIAIAALLLVHIPQPKQSEEGTSAQGNYLQEAWYGFKYIFERPSLLGLQLIFFVANLFAGIGHTLIAPAILAKTNNDQLIFGSVQSIGAFGGIAGGLLMTAWGGFKRHSTGVLLGWILSGVMGFVLFGFGNGVVIWGSALFLGALIGQLINASNQSIWMAKVAPDLQGRVFSARRLIAWLTTPISPIMAGVVADNVLEPAFRSYNSFGQIFSPVFGSDPGSGMLFLMVIIGLATALVGAIGFFFPEIRNAEEILPDHNQDAASLSDNTQEL